MNTAEDRVVVAGAGIAGLALARTLHQHDVTAVVLDRVAEPPRGGLALNLPGNAVRLLGLLGVGDALAHLGKPIRRREYRTAKNRLVFAVDEEAFWGDEYGSRCVRRHDLLALLRRDLPPDTIHWGRAISSVRHLPEGVAAVLADEEVERGKLLVGADGVHSAVRAAAFGNTAPRTAALSAASWRFMAPDPGIDCWIVWTDALGTFLLIPVDGGQVYGFASATRGGPVDPDPAWMRDTFARFPDPVPAVVETVLADQSSLYHSPIEEVRIPRWSDGPVVLIGDAAHATAPVWAQGAAMAIEDAVVLAELLATHDGWSRIGSEFERRRRPRITHVQTMTDRLSRAAALPGWLRNAIYPLVGPRTFRETYGPLRSAGP